jgi:hypothetical protein
MFIQWLQERRGTVEALLERVDEVPQERNGEFCLVIFNLPAEEQEHRRKAGRRAAYLSRPPHWPVKVLLGS